MKSRKSSPSKTVQTPSQVGVLAASSPPRVLMTINHEPSIPASTPSATLNAKMKTPLFFLPF
jgi:hypothetical protein